MSSTLPQSLTKNLSDAEAEVVSWPAETRELVLRLRKDIGEQSGLLRFLGVGRVNLVPRLTLAGIFRGGPDIGGVAVETGETAFVLEEALGATYYVVAASFEYSIEEHQD